MRGISAAMTQQLQHRIALGLFAAFSLVFAVNLFLLQPLERSTAFKRLGTSDGTSLETAATPAAPVATPVTEAAAPRTGNSGSSNAGPDAASALGHATPQPASPSVDPSLLAAVVLELKEKGIVMGDPKNPMDMVTRGAIMEAEWDNDLPLTGLPSETLLQRILMGAPSGALGDKTAKGEPGAAARDVILMVQQSLIMLGAPGLKADGLMGTSTQRAIRAFEAKNKMPQTGRISGALVKRFGDLAGQGKLTDRG